MKLGIVVLNWNGKDVTPRCLDSIFRSSCPAAHIVVVDNASTDGSVDLIRSGYPHVAVIVNDSNLGFAEGNNVGIRYLLDRAVDLILLLNNDAVLDSEALCALQRAAQAHSAAAYGATIYELSEPGAIWYAGGRISPLTLDARHEATTPGVRGMAWPTEFITGCCLMFRADALRTVGLLDRDFFAYYEDLDWCLRATRAGQRLLYVPEAMVRHDVSHSFRRAGTSGGLATPLPWAQSRPLVLYLAYRNRLLLARKHARGALHLAFLVTRRLVRAALHAGMLLLVGRHRQARAVVHGTRDGLRRVPQPAQVERYLSTPLPGAGPRGPSSPE
jgi:GT2 family glycosyltransferase